MTSPIAIVLFLIFMGALAGAPPQDAVSVSRNCDPRVVAGFIAVIGIVMGLYPGGYGPFDWKIKLLRFGPPIAGVVSAVLILIFGLPDCGAK